MVVGKLPLTAAEAVAFVLRTSEAGAEIRDQQGKTVSAERLRIEAALLNLR
jgi:hypothetical protein